MNITEFGNFIMESIGQFMADQRALEASRAAADDPAPQTMGSREFWLLAFLSWMVRREK